MTTTHIAAPDITIDGRHMRQRCAWCGQILLDYDLAQIAVPAGQDARPGVWPAMSIVAVDGHASWLVDDGTTAAQLSADSCVHTEIAAEETR